MLLRQRRPEFVANLTVIVPDNAGVSGCKQQDFDVMWASADGKPHIGVTYRCRVVAVNVPSHSFTNTPLGSSVPFLSLISS